VVGYVNEDDTGNSASSVDFSHTWIVHKFAQYGSIGPDILQRQVSRNWYKIYNNRLVASRM